MDLALRSRRAPAASVGSVSRTHRAKVPLCSPERAEPGARGAPEGSFNFRDIGAQVRGRPSGLRPGAVFRSGSLDGLSRRGWEQLAELGVRTIFDLRTAAERDAEPTAAPAELPVRVVSLPMWAARGSGTITATPEIFAARAGNAALASGSSEGAVREMGPRADRRAVEALNAYEAAKVGAYCSIAALHQPTLAKLVSELGTPGSVPCLVHCSAGKDRTGIAAAVLLRLAGAPCSTVVADYLASRLEPSERRLERYRPYLDQLGIPVERFLRPYGAHVPALSGAFEVMDERGGAVEGYLLRGGLTAAAVERALRAIT